MTSVLAVLHTQAARAPEQPALLAPGRGATPYGALLGHVETFSEQLRSEGIERSDRVALVLPNGPELAVAFLGTLASAVCAPLAPEHPRMQFERELAGLGARALIVERGHETAAREAAAALGIAVIELERGASAGAFTFAPVRERKRGAVTPDQPDDPALLLFTSGTTSTPKLVPLTEQSLLRSAANVAETLGLGPGDRCLNVMPLFHIHGLVAGLLASLVAGGSVVCTPGFRAQDVLAWIDELRPTWYTAVPTIHQAMLDVARSHAADGNDLRSAFRVIRSSSAALPVRVMEELEHCFGAPVIEAYGMTEAAHQMASNPLPPAPRKPGTVGKAAGVEIAVLDESGHVLPTGAVGEIGIRGPTVTAGYLDNPVANAAAYVDGWFRTGDQGRLDDEGFLTITGRLKEIINRGGEKVAPREIDEALQAHPEVHTAVAFAIPHARLGEEVGAAVVLRANATVTGPQLRVFVAAQLAPYKVPRRVVAVDQIPRGPTGKLDRRSLAEHLGLLGGLEVDPAAAPVPPADDVEREVASIWQRVLGGDVPPSVLADFFDLGGDSLHATELLVEIESAFDRVVPATIFFTSPTVRGMAESVRSPERASADVSVVRVQPNGSKPAVFCLLRGGSVVTTRHFADALGPDQPVFGLWAPTMHGRADAAGSVEEIAAACMAAMCEAQPEGPYVLFGHSLGGVVMYEVARQLAADGHVVGLLALADAMHPNIARREWRRRRTVRYRARKLLSRRGPSIIAFRVRRLLGRERPKPVSYVPGTDEPIDWAAAFDRERRYFPGPVAAPAVILSTSNYSLLVGSPDLGWGSVLDAGFSIESVPGSHETMIGEPHVHVLAAKLAEHIRRAESITRG